MLELRSGLKIFHNNHKVELVVMTDRLDESEIWKVRELETSQVKSELFERGDPIAFVEGGARYTL